VQKCIEAKAEVYCSYFFLIVCNKTQLVLETNSTKL